MKDRQEGENLNQGANFKIISKIGNNKWETIIFSNAVEGTVREQRIERDQT